MATGAALGRGIVILAAPVVTRLYTPGEYGVLAALLAMIALISVVANLRYEPAIVIPRDDEEAASLLTLALAALVLIVSLTAIIVGLVGRHLLAFVGYDQFSEYLWAVPLGVLVVGGHQAFSYWGIRKKAFGLLARTQFAQGSVQAGGQVALGALGLGSVGLIAGYLAGSVIGTASLLRSSWSSLRRSWTAMSVQKIMGVAGRYRSFPLISTWGVLLNTASTAAPVLALGALYDVSVAGMYGLVERVLIVPMALLGDAVSKVFISEVPRLARDNPEHLQSLYLRTAGKLAGIALVPLALVVSLGPALFRSVFGSAWADAGAIAQLLAGAAFFQFVVTPITHLNLLERQGLYLAWTILRATLAAAAFAAAWAFHAPPQRAIALYAVAAALAYIALGLSWSWALRHRIRVKRSAETGTAMGVTNGFA